ncbi:MAG: hypothetical protein KUL82_07730 [Bdellovibrio sp.]|nr:hypothetical protein [Bdellovibrio sp.]
MSKVEEKKPESNKKTKANIWREHMTENRNANEDCVRLSMMLSLYGRLFGERTRFNQSITRVRIQSKNKRPSLRDLKNHYQVIVADLSHSGKKAMERTGSEEIVRRTLKEMGSNFILTSAWIGRKNVDLLLPGLTGLTRGQEGRGIRFTGVAIEVDGAVHDFTPKFLGDFAKDNFLSLIGILPVRIRNEETRRKNVLDALREMSVYSAMDSRAKRRMWKRIYLTTIFLNWRPQQIEEVFGINYAAAKRQIIQLLSLEGSV